MVHTKWHPRKAWSIIALFVELTPLLGEEVDNMVVVVDDVALTMVDAVTGAITRLVPSPELANFTLFGILTVTLRPLIIPFKGRGGDDDIKDDDDETQLEDDGDGDGVDGVGESRVSDIAEMFLAVNESAALLTFVILLFANATLVFVGDVPVGLV
uniref:Uncharacterized protein n=1 Tax=Bactrocera dorsalis TaxID=27457 RepID=A0A034WN53_BACDO